MSSAANTFFALPELLEMVLSHRVITQMQVLAMQRLNTRIQAIIVGSPSIQRKIFKLQFPAPKGVDPDDFRPTSFEPNTAFLLRKSGDYSYARKQAFVTSENPCSCWWIAWDDLCFAYENQNRDRPIKAIRIMRHVGSQTQKVIPEAVLDMFITDTEVALIVLVSDLSRTTCRKYWVPGGATLREVLQGAELALPNLWLPVTRHPSRMVSSKRDRSGDLTESDGVKGREKHHEQGSGAHLEHVHLRDGSTHMRNLLFWKSKAQTMISPPGSRLRALR